MCDDRQLRIRSYVPNLQCTLRAVEEHLHTKGIREVTVGVNEWV